MAETETTSSFTHEELKIITSSVLNELLINDNYLNDLPADATLDEINNHLAVLHGQSITINVQRGNEEMPVIIPQKGSRVSDLKRAIKRCVNLEQERKNVRRHISWKYVWKTYDLLFDDVIMDNNDELLSKYGIIHKSIVKFKKKLRKKQRF